MGTRQEGAWLLREYEGLAAVIPLDAIACNLPMSEIYLNVVFEEK